MTARADRLRTACWSFTASADPAANAVEVRRGIDAAAAAGARVLLTPECALTGYPGAARAYMVRAVIWDRKNGLRLAAPE